MLNKASKYFVVIISSIIFAIGLLLLLSIFIDFSYAKPKIDMFSSDGSFSFFTAGFYQKIKFLGLGVALLGVILIILYKNIQKFFYNFFISCSDFFVKFSKKITAFFIKESKFHIIVFFIIFAIAIVIRILFINLPLRYDEAYTYTSFIKEPILTTFSDYRSTNNHIFHTLLVRLSCIIFGHSFWAIRLPAFLFGLLIIPLTYTAARMLYNKNTALLSSAFIAASSILVEFSVNARGYTIICSMFLCIIIIGKYLKDEYNAFLWFVFSVLSIIGFFTMPIMLYPFLIVFIWLILSTLFKDNKLHIRASFKYLVSWTIFIIISTLMLYFRAIIKFGIRSAITSNISNTGNQTYFQSFLNLLKEIWFEWNRDFTIYIMIILVIGFIIAIIFHKKITFYKINLLFPILICFIPVSILQKNALNFGRHWLFLLPVYLIIASAGISFLINLLKVKQIKIKHLLPPILSLCVAMGLCFSIIFSGSIYKQDKKESFVEADEISVYLKNVIDPYDKILVVNYYPKPFLLYCFDTHSIPTGHLYYDNKKILTYLKETDELYIVLMNYEKINESIEIDKLLKLNYSFPEKVKDFDSSVIYKTHNLNKK